MKKLSSRQQYTIARAVEVQGVGYLTGKTVRLRFRPAPANTGVVFVRSDLGPGATIAAHADHVTGTARRTTLGQPPLSVGLVEHVLSALKGLQVDNCYVDLDAPEPPGLDGSAQAFVEALGRAGRVRQTGQVAIYTVSEPVHVQSDGATLAIYPTDRFEFRISYLLDYGAFSPIVRQRFTKEITSASYVREIANCRTFLLEEEAHELRKHGIGPRTQVTDLVVFDQRGPISNRLRFGDEPARHKVLDIIGDLSLLGCDLIGHLVAFRSGHPLNIEMVRTLQRRIGMATPRQRLAA